MEWTAFSDDIEEVFTKKELEKAPLMEPEQFKPPATWNETQLQDDQEQLVMGSMQCIADKVTSSHVYSRNRYVSSLLCRNCFTVVALLSQILN